jgi:hypothetical protein
MDDKRRLQLLETQNKLLLLLLLAFIGYYSVSELNAKESSKKITADIVEAKAITVVNPDGKNSATLETTRDGFVSLSFNDLKGRQRFFILMTPSGQPSICFSDEKVCRLSIGTEFNQNGDKKREEITLSLRDKDNNIIWHPDKTNYIEDK